MSFKLGIGLLILALHSGLSEGWFVPRHTSWSPYGSPLSAQAEGASAAAHINCFRTCTAKNTCTSSSLPTVCLSSGGVCTSGTCR